MAVCNPSLDRHTPVPCEAEAVHRAAGPIRGYRLDFVLGSCAEIGGANPATHPPSRHVPTTGRSTGERTFSLDARPRSTCARRAGRLLHAARSLSVNGPQQYTTSQLGRSQARSATRARSATGRSPSSAARTRRTPLGLISRPLRARHVELDRFTGPARIDAARGGDHGRQESRAALAPAAPQRHEGDGTRSHRDGSGGRDPDGAVRGTVRCRVRG